MLQLIVFALVQKYRIRLNCIDDAFLLERPLEVQIRAFFLCVFFFFFCICILCSFFNGKNQAFKYMCRHSIELIDCQFLLFFFCFFNSSNKSVYLLIGGPIDVSLCRCGQWQ